jgi:uncharacterized phage infection (PIP) family protein YhgE
MSSSQRSQENFPNTVEGVKANLADLNRSINGKNEVISTFKQGILDRISRLRESIMNKITELKGQSSQANERLTQLQSEIEKLQGQLREQQGQNRELQQELQELQRNRIATVEEIGQINASINQIKGLVNSLNPENTEIMTALDQLEALLNEDGAGNGNARGNSGVGSLGGVETSFPSRSNPENAPGFRPPPGGLVKSDENKPQSMRGGRKSRKSRKSRILKCLTRKCRKSRSRRRTNKKMQKGGFLADYKKKAPKKQNKIKKKTTSKSSEQADNGAYNF